MRNFEKLYFSVAGIPLSALKQDTLTGIQRIAELGLDALELEFVQGVRMKEEMALKVMQAAKNNHVLLTAHAPYFINLNSKEPQKVANSHQYILNTAKILSLCGGASFTFHPGFYLKDPHPQVYQTVKKELQQLVSTINKEYPDVLISPETTGKPSAFGSLDELLLLVQEIPGLNLCIDFAHLHARSNGQFNSYADFYGVLNRVKQIQPELLKRLHIHVSGISYGAKGEIKHLPLNDSDFKYQELLKALIEFQVTGVLVCESPILEEDALLLKKTYQELLS